MFNSTSKDYKEWLASLKVGDEVVVTTRINFGYADEIVKIERETPKRWVVRYGKQANKSDGKFIGEYSEYIRPVTDDVLADIAERKDRNRARAGVKWLDENYQNMEHEQIKELNKFLVEFKTKHGK